MTHHKNYDNESQDARRHDQQKDAHPFDRSKNNEQKAEKNHKSHSQTDADKRK